jgi:hypothetical protein
VKASRCLFWAGWPLALVGTAVFGVATAYGGSYLFRPAERALSEAVAGWVARAGLAGAFLGMVLFTASVFCKKGRRGSGAAPADEPSGKKKPVKGKGRKGK